ncbi:transposase [Nitrosopumilus sp. b3]|uniref:DDE-type integrase/transposase/recombinase n=1 Tax=Nitrosopumilus sp. b3 TaxID=2109909 RepID=UPI0015F439A0|nr:DDE-type integrase/transposase/recombinase [Nitrosopumilus sp. b3]KAF6246132.1 transposase [Nitrosopumilus sp. b3]
MVTKEYMTREERAQRLLDNPNTHILRINDNHYQMKSLATNRIYEIFSTEFGWKCTCPDHIYRKVTCKHSLAIQISIKLREEARTRNKIVIEEIGCDKCPSCHSTEIVKHGIRHNRNYDLQRYSCKSCRKRFSFNLGFEKMRVTPKVVTSAMQLYFTGESLRNVQKFIRLQGVDVAHSTVYKWIKKYTELMKIHLDSITPQVGDTWRADEVYTKIKGDKKYLFALMDDETRFWIAQEVADSKFKHDARNLLRMAKDSMDMTPRVFITDGLQAYRDAFKKEYGAVKKGSPIHIRHISLKGDRNNNKMERLNGEFRDREKVMRGVKKKDSVIFDGSQIYHNYVRPHMSLDGKTPAEACGIEVKGKDKWITLIQNAKKNL